MTVRSRLRRQGGWVGLVVLLLALVIAGWLARIALRQFAPPETPERATAAPTAVQRAKAVESDVAKQAEDLRKRIEEQEK
jgi:hypothetical protein